MVRAGTCLFVLVLSTLALAQAARPRAADVLPASKDLPAGYRLPWELDEDDASYNSEADWRAAHPALNVTAERALETLRALSDSAWRERTGDPGFLGVAPREVALAMSRVVGAPASEEPLQHALWHAVASAGTRADAIGRLEKIADALRDATVVAFVKTSTDARATLQVGVQIYTEDHIRDHARDMDLDTDELDETAPVLGRIAQAALASWATSRASELERSLLDEYLTISPDETRIRSLVASLAAIPDARTTVKVTRLPTGDAAHVYVERRNWPDAPEEAEGFAQLRVGVAVFDVELHATGALCAGVENDVDRLLRTLAARAGPFALAPAKSD